MIVSHHQDGVYVKAPFVDGARWDQTKISDTNTCNHVSCCCDFSQLSSHSLSQSVLAEQYPKILYDPMVILLKPGQSASYLYLLYGHGCLKSTYFTCKIHVHKKNLFCEICFSDNLQSLSIRKLQALLTAHCSVPYQHLISS